MNDSEYRDWLVALETRYHAAQVKAAVAVNGALIEFYWSLGRDIEERFDKNHYGAAFFERLSNDLCLEIPNVKGLSPINLRYANRFYRLYRNFPQLVEELKSSNINGMQIARTIAREKLAASETLLSKNIYERGVA